MLLVAVASALVPAALAQDPVPGEEAAPEAAAPASSVPPTALDLSSEDVDDASRALNERYSGTEDLRVRYYRSGDDQVVPGNEDLPIYDYIEVVNRLNLEGGNERVSLSIQGDAVGLFLNRYYLDDVLYHERDLYQAGVESYFPDAMFTAEKVNLGYRRRAWQLNVGDNYVSFGRGIAVNLVKNTDIDVDTSVRGVKAVGHAGQWDITVLSGVTNPQQVAMENANVAIRPDMFHTVTGARVERFGLGRFNLGAHGVIYQFARDAQTGVDPTAAWRQSVDAITTGASVEAVGLAGIDWYAEGDAFLYQAEELPVDLGYEGYVSAAAYPGRVSVLLEGKHQKNTEYLNTWASLNTYEIASGPTLEYERVITEDSSAAMNSNDLWAGRAKLDFPVSLPVSEETGMAPTLVPSLSQAVFRDLELGSGHFNRTPETISHTVGSLLLIAGDTHLQTNVGFRLDRRDVSDELGDLGADRLVHGDLALAIPIAGPVSIEESPSFMRFHWGANAQQQTDYTDFSNALAVKIGTPWAIIVYNDYSDNPLISSEGNLPHELFGEHWYGAVEGQWKPTGATTLKLFYGAYRAGIRCAGGQCRLLPGFDGARVSFTTAF